jgi:hypothetical protein
MKYIQLCLFAKIWHVSQIFPLPLVQAQQLTTIFSWYLCQGATFSMPLVTLQRPRQDGGWGLPNVVVKCKTLLYHRITMLGAKGGNVTTDLIRYWHVQEPLTNPTYNPPPRIPAKLVHLRDFVSDMAYVAPLAPDERSKHFKRRIYNAFHTLTLNASPPTKIRIVKKFPRTAWNQVWRNLHASPVSDEIKSTWYKVLHDLIPTNYRLAAINLTDSSVCSLCSRPDPLQHKITECGEGPVIWTWTKKLLAYILSVDHRQIPQTWTIRLDFHHCSAQRHSAVPTGLLLTSFNIVC